MIHLHVDTPTNVAPSLPIHPPLKLPHKHTHMKANENCYLFFLFSCLHTFICLWIFLTDVLMAMDASYMIAEIQTTCPIYTHIHLFLLGQFLFPLTHL